MISSSEIKRQILMDSDRGEVRQQLKNSIKNGGITEGEIIEMGQALEQTVKSKGWSFIEAYIFKRMNITGLVFGKDDPDQKGIAKGYILLMQYIDQVIKTFKSLTDERN